MTYPRLRKEETLEEQRLLNAALDNCPSKVIETRLLSTLGFELGSVTTVTASNAWASPTNGTPQPPNASITNASYSTLRHSSPPVSHPFGPFMQWIGLAGVVIGFGASAPLVVNQFGHTLPVQRENGQSHSITSASTQRAAEPSTLTTTSGNEHERHSPTEVVETAAKALVLVEDPIANRIRHALSQAGLL